MFVFRCCCVPPSVRWSGRLRFLSSSAVVDIVYCRLLLAGQGAILVRVSRLWEYRGGSDSGRILHVGMVLIDEERNAIYAEIGRDDVAAKKSLVTEEEVYVFRRFRVVGSKSSYRAVQSKYMINITYHTIIEKASEPIPNIPHCVFTLTKFTDIHSMAGETENFIDLIGIVTEVYDVQQIHIQYQARPTAKRTIILKDSKQHEMKVSLWGQRAHEFDADAVCELGQQKPVVVIFVGLLAKIFRGEYTVSGNTACRWYINPEVPETRMLLDSIGSNFHPVIRVPITSAESQNPACTTESAVKTLSEIKNINPYDFPFEGFRCTVTLSRYNAGQAWWFPSCNRCSFSCLPEGSGYRCPKDGCRSSTFKYKLLYIATDGTAEVELIFFNDTSRRLVGKDVRVMMRQYPDPDQIPTEITAQVGQAYDITVNVTNRAFETSVYPYEVKKIHAARGRQPAVPRAIVQASTPNAIVQAGSSTSQPIETEKQQNVQIDVGCSVLPTKDDKNAPISSTAPVSVVATPISPSTDETSIARSRSSDCPKDPTGQPNARRALFLPGQQTSDDDSGLEDSRHHNTKELSSEFGRVHPTSSKKLTAVKRAKNE